MTSRALAIVAVAAAFAVPMPASAQDAIVLTPAQIGQIFCVSMLGNDMAPVEAILTPGLRSAIADAEAQDAAWAAAHPGDKPPLGDGIPWQDAPDYAATCTVGDVTLMMDEATVKIAHGFPEYPQADFIDTLWLKLVPDTTFGASRWRIDNLAYAGEGDLRTALKSAFMD
jgi:hypothetical protein